MICVSFIILKCCGIYIWKRLLNWLKINKIHSNHSEVNGFAMSGHTGFLKGL